MHQADYWIRSPLGLESHGGRALAGGHQDPRRSPGWTGSARHHGRPVPVIVSSRSCPASSPGAGGTWRGADRPGGSWSGTRHSSAVPVPAGFADLTDLSADAMSSSTGARSTGPHTGRMADLERAHPRAAHSALRRNDRVAECSACSSSPREAGLGAVAAGDRNAEWITFRLPVPIPSPRQLRPVTARFLAALRSEEHAARGGRPGNGRHADGKPDGDRLLGHRGRLAGDRRGDGARDRRRGTVLLRRPRAGSVWCKC
jgi:hypothetical protein